jgi:hypothetical protein
MKDDLDKVRFYCAAAYTCAKAHDTKLSNLTFEDICKFMDSLDGLFLIGHTTHK